MEIEYATYKDLKERGIVLQGKRIYPFDEDDTVYTYNVYCKDNTVWAYSSEDEIFTREK